MRRRWLLGIIIFEFVAGLITVLVVFTLRWQAQQEAMREISKLSQFPRSVVIENAIPLVPQKFATTWLPIFNTVVQVDLSGTNVKDDDLKFLRKLPYIQVLHLQKTSISDKGLEYVAEVRTLREVDLFHTDVSDDGIRKLQKALNPYTSIAPEP